MRNIMSNIRSRKILGHMSQPADAEWLMAFQKECDIRIQVISSDEPTTTYFGQQFDNIIQLPKVNDTDKEINQQLKITDFSLVITTLESAYGRSLAAKAANENTNCIILQPGYEYGFLLSSSGLEFLKQFKENNSPTIIASMQCKELTAIENKFEKIKVIITGHPAQFLTPASALNKNELLALKLDSKKKTHCYIGTVTKTGSINELNYIRSLESWLQWMSPRFLNNNEQGIICLHPRSSANIEETLVEKAGLKDHVIVTKKHSTDAVIASFSCTITGYDSSMLMSRLDQWRKNNKKILGYFNLSGTFTNMAIKNAILPIITTQEQLEKLTNSKPAWKNQTVRYGMVAGLITVGLFTLYRIYGEKMCIPVGTNTNSSLQANGD